MRLSDVMSAMQMSHYAEVALVLFMAAFAVIAIQLFGKRAKSEWEHASRLPLADDADTSEQTREQ